MAMRVLATGLAVVVLGAAPAHASPRVREFGMPVAAAATAASGARVSTTVLRPATRFDLVGLRWRSASGPVNARVRVRVHGRWGRWVPLADADDHGPDGAGAVHGTDPVWAGGADALQLSYRRVARGLRASFVRVTHRPHVRPRAHASQAGPPPMVPRSEWDPANQCAPRSGPAYGTVQMAFVHHTVSANEYGPQDSAAIVLSMCRYHRDSNGWNDIGYNFLVDKYGRLFEGRAGGVDKPVVGAQAQGWNSQSTSVSNIGTYTDAPQTDAAIDATASLLAWKLPLHGVPVTGQVTLTSGGGEQNRYSAGSAVTFERISGHRDGGLTECPGNALYAQLPQLRALTAQRAPFPVAPAPITPTPGTVTVSAVSTALVYPEPMQLAGTLQGAGRVSIQVASGSRWVTIARAQPGGDGAWTSSVPLARGRTVRAVQVMPNGKVGGVSARVTVSVAPSVTAHATRRVRAGSSVLVRGTVAPRKRALRLEVSKQGKGGTMARVSRTAVRVTRGRYAIRMRLRRAGLYRLRVRFAGDAGTKPAYAPDVYVRAVRRAVTVSGGTEARAG